MKYSFIILILMCCSCSTHYEINVDSVKHISWNEGTGKVVKEVKNADPETFKQLNSHYGKDKEHVFWDASVVEGAHSESFVAINDYYGMDAYHGIINAKIISKSDGSSFEYLGNNWSRDSDNYFYNGEKLQLCDYDTFKIIKSLLSDRAIDSKCMYYKSKRVPIKDFQSLILLPANYAKDNFYVYWGDSIVKGVDPKTFEVKDKSSLSIAKDKNTCYNATQILSCSELNPEGKNFCGCSQ